MTAAKPEVFEKAADYIAEHGWWKNGLGDGNGPQTCISSALSRVLESSESREPYEAILLPHFGFEDCYDGLISLYGLNDSQPIETGQQWAVDNLRACAQKLRGEQS